MIYVIDHKCKMGDIKYKLFKAQVSSVVGVSKQLSLSKHKAQFSATVYYFL